MLQTPSSRTAPARPAWLAAALVGLLAASCGDDRARLVSDDATAAALEPEDLAVVDYEVDPPAGDEWQTLVAPDPDIVTEGDPFREADSRHADDDERARARRLFTATAPGRTVLVEYNCAGCRNGEATLDRPDHLHAWLFDVGGGSTALTWASGALAPGPTTVSVGERIVIVADAVDSAPPVEAEPGVVRVLARTEAGHPVTVLVLVAAGPGRAVIEVGGTTYTLTVR